MKMVKALIGKKIGMTQIFKGNGEVIPVTVLYVGPCKVLTLRTIEKNGYQAVQLGFESVKLNKLNKPQQGYFKKLNLNTGYRIIKEVSVDTLDDVKEGDEIRVDLFKEGERVDVTGTSKGRGFQGVMKRFGFGGGPDSHGSSLFHRRPGSIGATTDPGRVIKGKKLPGRMGRETVTVRNLEVVGVDVERNLIYLKGAVPGARNSVVIVKKK